MSGNKCQNWCVRVKKFYSIAQLVQLSDLASVAQCYSKAVVKSVRDVVINNENTKWLQTVNRQTARRVMYRINF